MRNIIRNYQTYKSDGKERLTNLSLFQNFKVAEKKELNYNNDGQENLMETWNNLKMG
jgi:hypothetical protein